MRWKPETMTLAELWTRHKRINVSPAYQRLGDIWSHEKKSRLIDSVFNGFDMPKFYFHKKPEDDPYEWDVIDGKQRLTTLLQFRSGEFELGKSFLYQEDQENRLLDPPKRGQTWSELSEESRNLFNSYVISVTAIKDASEDEIKQFFLRLNEGVVLNEAEKRQGIGGAIIDLAAEIEQHPFFRDFVSFSNGRFQHKDAATKLIFMESQLSKDLPTPDLTSKNLWRYVEENSELDQLTTETLRKNVVANLSWMSGCFAKPSPELKSGAVPVFYLWLRGFSARYSDPRLQARIMKTIEDFTVERTLSSTLNLEEKPQHVREFEWQAGQGTTNGEGIQKRADVYHQLFLLDNTDVVSKDPKRSFTSDERYVIWILGGKVCQECGAKLETLGQMHADHVIPHSRGGTTSISNGQSLCARCNTLKGASG